MFKERVTFFDKVQKKMVSKKNTCILLSTSLKISFPHFSFLLQLFS